MDVICIAHITNKKKVPVRLEKKDKEIGRNRNELVRLIREHN